MMKVSIEFEGGWHRNAHRETRKSDGYPDGSYGNNCEEEGMLQNPIWDDEIRTKGF